MKFKLNEEDQSNIFEQKQLLGECLLQFEEASIAFKSLIDQLVNDAFNNEVSTTEIGRLERCNVYFLRIFKLINKIRDYYKRNIDYTAELDFLKIFVERLRKNLENYISHQINDNDNFEYFDDDYWGD